MSNPNCDQLIAMSSRNPPSRFHRSPVIQLTLTDMTGNLPIIYQSHNNYNNPTHTIPSSPHASVRRLEMKTRGADNQSPKPTHPTSCR